MSNSSYDPSADPAMHNLFKQEVEMHAKDLTSGLLDFEKATDTTASSEKLMRAAHSIKGAARMVGVDVVVSIAHIMEDCFVAAQANTIKLSATCVDVLLKGIDAISAIAEGQDTGLTDSEIEELTDNLEKIKLGQLSTETTGTSTSNKADDSDDPMLALFKADAINIYAKINKTLELCFNSKPSDKDIDSILNNLHTIRGGAKLCGANIISEFCALIEDLIKNTKESGADIDLSAEADISTALNALSAAIRSSVSDNDNEDLVKLSKVLKELISYPDETKPETPTEAAAPAKPPQVNETPPLNEHSIKISTQRLNKLVGLAGESVLESRWVRSHADSMLIYKRRQSEIINALDNLRNHLDETNAAEHVIELFGDIQKRANDARSYLGSRLSELDDYDRRITGLSGRLNLEVLQTRMRPFSDCTHGFDRMIRDIARSLGKSVDLKIIGENTQVDREILSRIEAPLNHILRNAIDHGIETTEERIANGKPETATIKVEASHNMGMLSISISDDGRGVDMKVLRKRILDKKLSNKAMINSLSDAELLDFLYLPGFSTRNDITEISGRGVGLDVVHSTIQEMRGKIRTSSVQGKGINIQLLLPLTLSVIRSLLVSIGGQAYAFPLARIDSIHTLAHDDLKTLEGKQYFTLNDKHIGLIDASQVLEVNKKQGQNNEIYVIVLGDRNNHYGLVVEKFIGERDIAVHVLDPRLGKIRDISAATLLEDGNPALVIDIEDMIRSIEIILSGERLSKIKDNSKSSKENIVKRVLVVDDSITVREVEKKLLESHGYHVELAVDGMDGWNTVHNGTYDLIISDVDMPRMNGIEFVKKLKMDHEFRKIPVMIVSYKDREEDRAAGLDAGADYYLTKGSFHDESLIDAVIDLIGEAD
ncbi:MAG: hybrid sensor histidine kinase/response regulator [Sulfuriflexus sp.]|nr:hybrid sensor histidine kinase/response regulator [Sulfuriflexus sp.]